MATIIDTIVAKRKAKDAGLNPIAPPAQPTPIFPVSSPKGNTSSALAIAEAKKTGENVYSPPPQIGTAYDSGVVKNPALATPVVPPKVAGVSSGVTRAAPTVATPGNPAVTIGTAPSTTAPSLSMKDIAWKLSQKEPLTKDEFSFYYDESTKPKEVTTADIYKPAFDESQRQIDEAQKRYDTGYKSEQDLKAARIAENNARIDAKYSSAITDAYSQGEQVKEASQQALSFSGFGRSTENASRQAEIEQKTQQAVASLRSQQETEKALFEAQANNESEAKIGALGEQLSSLKTASAKLQIEAAQKVAEMNASNNVNSSAAISNLIESISKLNPDQAATIDKDASELLGYVADASGNPVVKDENGNPMPISKKESDMYKPEWRDPVTNQLTGDLEYPGGYFDPNTRTFIPISFGGNRGQGEFPTPAGESVSAYGGKKSKVAEYTVMRIGSSEANGKPIDTKALELAGNYNSAITSPISGTVVDISSSGPFGNHITIKDENGLTHQFSHLNNMNVKVGQKVIDGSMIGTMGNTGNVRKSDGTVPTAEELAAGRGTHLNYRVYDQNGAVMEPSVPMSFAGVDMKLNDSQLMKAAQDAGLDINNPKEMANVRKNYEKYDVLPKKQLTEGEKVSAGFASRLEEADGIISDLEKYLSGLSPQAFIALANRPTSGIFGSISNYGVPVEYQKYEQAQRNFINAQLRKESGATISPEEFENARQQYFPQPGNPPEVIEQKRKNRENALKAMLVNSGQKPSSYLFEEEYGMSIPENQPESKKDSLGILESTSKAVSDPLGIL